MAQMNLDQIADKMRDIDVAMLTTRSGDGQMASRPMSHSGEVEENGDTYFFTTDDTATVAHIVHDARVGLTFQGRAGIVGQRPFLVAVEGVAELIRDRAAFKAHWREDLTRWFARDIDTEGLVLLKIRANRIHYWDGDTDEGEISFI